MEEKPRLRPWVIALPVALALLVGLVWLVQRLRAPVAQALETVVPFREQRAQAMAPQYQPNPPVPTPDPHAEALAQLHAELARLRAEQEQLQARLAVRQTTQEQPTKTAASPPKPKPHRAMRHEHYELPEAAGPRDPETFPLLPGTYVPCQVETVVHSDVGNSTFVARVSRPVYDTATQQTLLIPQNAKIVGKALGAELAHGNERLNTVALTLSRRGDKQGIELGEAPITDGAGQAGLVSEVSQRFWQNLSAMLLFRGLVPTLSTAAGVTGPAGMLANGVGQAGAQFAQQQTQRLVNTRPRITVASGESCAVILTKPLRLTAAVQ